MTFNEALYEYHKGKKIRRSHWDSKLGGRKGQCFWVPLCDCDQEWKGSVIEWMDILADDWIAEG